MRRLGHRPALDGIRGLAIAGVMGLHADARLFRGGLFGVDVFFVLSAFLITSLILEEVDERGGQYGFKAFYLRRALRLGPALALWLVFVAAPTAVALGQADSIASSTLASLLYVGDVAVAYGIGIGDAYDHVWSLAVEEQFYAAWPVVLVVLLRKHPGALRRGLWIASAGALVITLASAHLLAGRSYFLPTGHLVPIAAGCLAAHAFAYGVPRRAESLIRAGLTGICAAVAIVAAFVAVAPAGPPEVAVAVQCIVAAAATLLVLHLCLAAESPLMTLFTSAPAVWLGRRSYGLYLYHRTLALLVPALVVGIQLRVAGPLVLLLAAVVAEVSFRLVERPVSRAGRRWMRERRYPGARAAESDLPIHVV
jgi:peptidoglycan/LPS O-acetylase OafA/YrhL